MQALGSHIQQLVGQTPVYALYCLHLACIKAQAPLQGSIRRMAQQCNGFNCPHVPPDWLPDLRHRQQRDASLRIYQPLPRSNGSAHKVQREHSEQGRMAVSQN